MKRYLVMDIGCIECGEPSRVVGLYTSKKEAIKVRDEYASSDSSWGRPEWGGQHAVEVHDIKTKEYIYQ